jgi:hypothetical protein
VVRFAGDADPIALIVSRARDLVLRARDAGWSGPPYNPVAIADLLSIPVEASSDVADARTVAAGNSLRIQFNPVKPRERVRFSIAHEIAHTLFPDVADEARHRGGTSSSTDEWQLEMLCNIAAAEFIMPIGSLSSSEKVPPIEHLMVERRTFDVSAEAFLIRTAKSTSEPLLMFCAAPVVAVNELSHYRIDYSVPSKTYPHGLPTGVVIPKGSVVANCTAIGQTDRAKETWATGEAAQIECVGIPGYAGATYPRVAGIVRIKQQETADPLKYVHGDVLSPVGSGPRLICQLVNDQAKVWGGGIAKAASKRYPAAHDDYATWFVKTKKADRLGQVHFAKLGNDMFLASLVAQEGYGPSLFPRLRYVSLEQCFQAVAEFCVRIGGSVHMPRLGSGQSGGAWETVEELVRETLVPKGVPVTVYDLPPKRQNDTLGQLF